jgi:hypothetical protein
MGYLINAARPSSLKIGGTERINQLRSFQVSDTSSYRNGIVTTTGTIVLGTSGHLVTEGGLYLEDYKRDDYKRGTKITFDVTYPSGTTARHPRGLLNVISTVYSPETATITIDVGCDLVMAKLLGDDSIVLPFEEVPLDETTKTFEGVSSSLATAAKLIWQDNQGNIQSKAYFEGDAFGQYQPGAFVSVRGVTALAVEPLAATAAIPDRLELSFQSPVDGKAQDDQGRVDVVTTESNYFIKYPATVFERIKGATVDMKTITAGGSVTIPGTRGSSSPSTGCGNTPSPPTYSPSVTIPIPGQERTIQIPAPCSVGYETKSVPQYIPAKRREIRTTTYDGPAAQTSSTKTEVYGPALELNSQYWADKFAYCGSTYANECLPSPCPMYGTYETRLGKQETVYFYGSANEVIKQVTSTYRPVLAAAQPDDWRSGVTRGIAQDFDQGFGEKNAARLYLHQVVIRKFSTENNANVQKTTTYTSSTSRGGGIGGQIGAYKGIKTTEVRRSVSSVTSEIRPDSVNAATTSVDTDTTFVEMHGQVGGFVGGAGPYVQKEDTPVPLLYDSRGEVQSAVNKYGDYLARFIEGDARGLTIGEALREQIGSNWTPNMPFRYYDPNSQDLMAFRADACSWGADPNGCIVVLSGIWVADMAGTVSIPDNLTGNAQPNMSDGAPVAPTPPVNPDPTVTGDTATNKRFNFFVEVPITAKMLCNPSGEDGIRVPPPGPQTIPLAMTLVTYVRGYISQPGAMVALENDGSLPLNGDGTLIVDDALIIIDDDVLFPPTP